MSTMWFALLLPLFCGICLFEVTDGLQCWDCRSDGINSSFCGDYFDKDLITDQQRNYVFTKCTVPESIKNPSAVPKVAVCRLMKQTDDLNTVVYRGCHYQDDGIPRDCLHGNYNDGIKTEYCMTCTTDGCNAALDFDLLKHSLLANDAVGMTHPMNVSLIIASLMFYGFF